MLPIRSAVFSPITRVCRQRQAMLWLAGLLGGLLLGVTSASAQLTNASVTPADLTAGATTSYTVSFNPAGPLDSVDIVDDVLAIQTQAGGPNFENAILQSLSGGSLTGAIATVSQSATLVNIDITSGTATAADTITFVLANVVNPGAGGQGPDYTVRTVDFANFPPAPDIDEATVAGSVYAGTGIPAVTLPLSDQTVVEEDGPAIVVMDLNDNFVDGDGDPLTFTVDAVDDLTIANASINGNELTVIPIGSGTTDITIRASDLPSGSGEGSVTDTFEVRSVGELGAPSVTPTSLDAGATTSYSISFVADSGIDSNNFFGLNSGAGGPDYSSATISSLTGGSIIGSIFGQTSDGISINVTSGTASLGDVITLTLDGVVNPGLPGQGPDYTLLVIDSLAASQVSRSTLAGNVYAAVGGPTVVTPIDDQTLDEFDGTPFVVADLNTVFADGDGDDLTFTVDAGNDTNIAIASVNGDELTVTPAGSGTTTITVRASDLPSGTGEGDVADSFDVRVVGEIDNPVVTPATLDTDEVTTYSVQFNPASNIEAGQFFVINTSSGGPDFSAATLGSVGGGTLTASFFQAPGTTGVSIEIESGAATPSDTVEFVVNNVSNPSSGGQGPDYQILLFSSSGTNIDRTTFAGNVYIDAGLPVVDSPISNQLLEQQNGPSTVVMDLNTVFIDGDGDILTFSIDPGNDPSVATAQVNGSELIITPAGTGTTTITVRASDLPTGTGEGEVTDAFDLRVIGLLVNASVSPQSLDATQATEYVVDFEPASSITNGDFLVLSTLPGGADFSLSGLENLSGGTLQGQLTGQNTTGVTIEIISGAAGLADTVQFTLSAVQNPFVDGFGPDYTLELVRATDVIDNVTIPGSDFVIADTLFEDSFEQRGATSKQRALSALASIPFSYRHLGEHPRFESDSAQYRFFAESLDIGAVPEEALFRWLEAVLSDTVPNGDWDGDGLRNILDHNPFGR